MMRSIALRLRTAPRRFPERLARFSTAMKTTSTDPLSLKVFEDLRDMKDAGTFKTERVIISPQRAKISVENRKEEVINMCANNYLGLSSDPELIEAAKEAMDTHGLGLSSVRFICGTQDIHKELEEKISNFHQTEDTILYPSCFDANAGFFETVLTKEDAIISDALNHASIIDGVRLCKAARFRFDHMCMKSLEENLIAAKDARIKMIATDGVFSMDGDIAPLDEICALAEKHGAYVFVDECHATGFIGPTGRGTPELKGVMDKVLVITSTLGKALGGATGGYTTGPAQLISLLRNKSRPYLFSNTLAPCVVGASLVVFDRLSKDTSLRDKLEANTTYFREAMSGYGFEISGDPACPIVPVMLGDARLAAEFADEMLERGIYVIGFSYPVVPKGKARIRTQISAAHSQEQLQHAVQSFVEVGRAKGVIS
uniref:2-amino-3-ketobutyrate coenzyme A ligase, mitochondrial n=2 Tax=Lotharella globosa TaxID=91324 RepID=A0A6U3C8J3_9EUKA|mmetsp:Transcript_29562/g.57646  ORF Transcript_29562/g.57646 Transcript_29562/m.57646 type:complete len:429 (+) Transcript_29562:29-1315(+)